MLDEDNVSDATWTAVIGKALCYFALSAKHKETPFKTVSEKVDFLEGLGLPLAAAAEVAGTTKASVVELRRQQKVKKNVKVKQPKRGR
jgi:hypothetical protein